MISRYMTGVRHGKMELDANIKPCTVLEMGEECHMDI